MGLADALVTIAQVNSLVAFFLSGLGFIAPRLSLL